MRRARSSGDEPPKRPRTEDDDPRRRSSGRDDSPGRGGNSNDRRGRSQDRPRGYGDNDRRGGGDEVGRPDPPFVVSREGEGRPPAEGGRGRGGRGRGRGARGGRGGRGEPRGGGRARIWERTQNDFDLVISRPVVDSGDWKTKRGDRTNSKRVPVHANFFRIQKRPDWALFHYRVDFSPEQEDTRRKKQLIRAFESTFGKYIFDGESLYISYQLSPDPMVLMWTPKEGEGIEEKVEINIRLVSQLAPTDVTYLQLFNILVRTCFQKMGMEEMGRYFYDPTQGIKEEAQKLEIWPGYKTSIRHHENDILFCVELTHKVLRKDSCYVLIQELEQRHPGDRQRIKEKLVGQVVMTSYNRKTYRVDDIDFDKTPMTTFDRRGEEVSFAQYFYEQYNVSICYRDQPMLVSRPRKRDLHRGMSREVLLVPELCQMTGLEDEMRQNHNLMRALAKHLNTDPDSRVQKVSQFVSRFIDNTEVKAELGKWGLGINKQMVKFDACELPKEKIRFQMSTDPSGKLIFKEVEPNNQYDWSHALKDTQMLSCIDLKSWAVIHPSRDGNIVTNLVQTMSRVGRNMRFRIGEPLKRQLGETRPNKYAEAIEKLMNETGGKLQLIFIILPRQETDTYSAVKKKACLQYGVPSQCFVAKTANNSGRFMSVCTKLVVQMNAKLGGEPWTVAFPLKKLMVIGYDVYHCGKRTGQSVGAMVASTCDMQTKYFSTTCIHNSREEVGGNVATDFTKCLSAYHKVNNFLPDRIFFYRDGVGDGQLKYVYDIELAKIKESLKEVYTKAGLTEPKFSFIVVTKKLNTRIFTSDNRGTSVNPNPGTVVDDVITLPERYDFYLIAQHSRMGTVSPVAYNVLHDTQSLSPDKMQKLTFKLCHMYFNWSGTVTVPAPCQYAKKLAYLTGLTLKEESNQRLSNLLYFL